MARAAKRGSSITKVRLVMNGENGLPLRRAESRACAQSAERMSGKPDKRLRGTVPKSIVRFFAQETRSKSAVLSRPPRDIRGGTCPAVFGVESDKRASKKWKDFES